MATQADATENKLASRAYWSQNSVFEKPFEFPSERDPTHHEIKPQTVVFYAAKLNRLLSYEPLRGVRADRIDEGLIEGYVVARYPRIQIFTIEELLGGKQVEYPAHCRESTFKRAPRHREAPAENLQLPLSES
jgi:hypothetical protein